MPVPAVIGIGALWGALSSAITSLIGWAVTFFTRKLAILAIVVAAAFTAINVLLGYVASTMTPLLSSFPNVEATLTMALPSNTQTCITAIISIELACLVYSLAMKVIALQSKVI